MNEEQAKPSLWLPCPKCGARTKIKIYEDTVLLNFPLYCTKCKEETKLGVIEFIYSLGRNTMNWEIADYGVG